MSKKYFMAEEKEDGLNIVIYGDITSWEWLESDISSYTLSKLIRDSGVKTITVSINSYGGEVAEGLAIYNALKNHPAHVITICDGFACSAASVVFMAGDERIMNKASLLMIHNAWTYACGNAETLRKEADDLEVISDTVAKTYLESVTISEEELQTLLDEESWITPEDALSMGFATSVGVEQENAGQQYSARRKIIGQLTGNSVATSQREERKREKSRPEELGKPETGFRQLFHKFT